MPFPDITEKDFSSGGKNNKDVHDILDYAVSQWNSRVQRAERLEKLYNSYNGITSKEDVEAITKSTGKLSKTKFVQYRLGRTKLKQLHGEFLEINIDHSVRTTNRDAVNRKMNKYKQMLGMAYAKPQIEKVRELGYDVFPGMKVPDLGDKNFWNANNFKLANEIVMQRILNDKMKSQRLKSIFYWNFVDCTIVSEMFGKVERDVNGVDTYRFIPSKYAMYEESIHDMYLDQSPYLGEVRPMYIHEILTNKEFNLDSAQVKQVKDYADSSASQYKSDDLSYSTGNLINTYTLQWKGLEPVWVKISPAKGSSEPYYRIISDEYYAKNESSISRDVRQGKYQIEKYQREILWTCTRIGKDVYTPARKEKYLIQYLNENNKYNVQFDYGGMLFSTVDGIRVSVQEIIMELEKIYDEIRFNINREMKKLKGTVVYFDEAFSPKGKRYIDVIHSITEDGIIRFNSSAEGNTSGLEAQSNQVGVGALNLGQNQNLMILLNQAMDIERVMDRITGMNDNRQGLSKATTTATANVNSIEASRSMTYDLFYFMQEYIERVLTKLVEKTKINITYVGADQRQFIFDDSDMMYLLSTKDIDQDSYGVTITDGKKEKDILNKLETLFPQEINASQLRSKDVARFWTESSFAAALRVLDQAHDEIANIRMNELKAKQETDYAAMMNQRQMANEDREDRQAHEKDLKVIGIEGDKELTVLEKSLEMQATSTEASMNAVMERQSNKQRTL